MFSTDPLMALSPLDGRYGSKLEALREIFSEYGLIKRRVTVEVAWLEALCDEPAVNEARPLDGEEKVWLRDLADGFSLKDARRVKAIESATNHDVKAVEYFIKERIAATSLADLGEFVHFACTTEDNNNLAHALMLRDGMRALNVAMACAMAVGEALRQTGASASSASDNFGRRSDGPGDSA